MENCLEEAGRMLQREIDKQLADGGTKDDLPKQSAKDPAAAVKAQPAPYDEDDPDGMMAAFFAKQRASKEASEKLPVEEWARTIIAHANESKEQLTHTSDLSANEQIIDHLWQRFSALQEES